VVGSHWNGLPGWYDKVWVFDLGGPPSGPIQWGQFRAAQAPGRVRVSDRFPRAAAGPTLTTISRARYRRGVGFELMIDRDGFRRSSVVQVNGSAR